MRLSKRAFYNKPQNWGECDFGPGEPFCFGRQTPGLGVVGPIFLAKDAVLLFQLNISQDELTEHVSSELDLCPGMAFSVHSLLPFVSIALA